MCKNAKMTFDAKRGERRVESNVEMCRKVQEIAICHNLWKRTEKCVLKAQIISSLLALCRDCFQQHVENGILLYVVQEDICERQLPTK